MNERKSFSSFTMRTPFKKREKPETTTNLAKRRSLKPIHTHTHATIHTQI